MVDLVPTSRLSNRGIDNRLDNTQPIARTEPLEIIVPDLVKTKSETIRMNGQITHILTAAPAIPTDANFTITLADEDGNVWHVEAAIADASNVFTDVISDNVIVVGIVTVTVSFVTDLSGNTAAFDVVFILQSRV